jgi:hypothetical protein
MSWRDGGIDRRHEIVVLALVPVPQIARENASP